MPIKYNMFLHFIKTLKWKANWESLCFRIDELILVRINYNSKYSRSNCQKTIVLQFYNADSIKDFLTNSFLRNYNTLRLLQVLEN